jgi:hypothetical protein
MKDEYVVSEIVEVGAAQDLIRDHKGNLSVDDAVGGYGDAVAFDE